MDITWTLNLPRDTASVPLVRRLLVDTMDTVGVDPDVTFDIGLALTEACANAVEHAGTGAAYRVRAGIDADRCRIDVIDEGPGVPRALSGAGEPAFEPLAEHGRGLNLLRSLVDRVALTSDATGGGVVHFEKDLRFRQVAGGDGTRVLLLWHPERATALDGTTADPSADVLRSTLDVPAGEPGPEGTVTGGHPAPTSAYAVGGRRATTR